MKKVSKLLAVLLAAAMLLTLVPAVSATPSIDDAVGTGTNGVIKVACVGDSITEGFMSSNTATASYPAQLQNMLDSSKYEVKNFGIGGRCAMKEIGSMVESYWNNDFYTQSKNYKPDVVIIMLGTNDVVDSLWDPDTYKNDLKDLAASYMALDSNPVVFLATPIKCLDSDHTEIPVAAAKAQEAAAELDIPFVNTLELTSDWTASDFAEGNAGIHPNDGGYLKLAGIFYENVFKKTISSLTVLTKPNYTVSVGGQKVKADADGVAVIKTGDGVKTVRIMTETGDFTDLEINVRGNTTADCTALVVSENLALSATAIATDLPLYAGNAVEYMNDNDESTSWQLAETPDNLPIFAGYDFGEPKTFSAIDILWESGTRPTQSGYKFQYSNDNSSWTDINATKQYSDGGVAATFTAVTARYVRIYITAVTSNKNYAKIYEFRVSDSSAGFEPTVTYENYQPPVSFTAYQLSADGKELRAIAAVDSLEYDWVGFTITAEDNRHSAKTKTYKDNKVYTSLITNDVTVTSEDFGIEGGYLAVIIIENIPEYAGFSVNAFVTKGKETTEGDAREITVGEPPVDDGIYPITGDNATKLRNLEIKDIDNDGVIRVACLGDSITAGNQGNNWPLYLQELLNYQSSVDGNTYVVTNHGKGGAAVHHYLEQYPELDTDGDGWAYFYYDDKAYTSAFTYTPDIVLIQFGTNDAFGDYKSYMEEDYYTYLVKPFLDQGAQIVMATPTYACNGLHDGTVNGEMHDYEVALAEKWNFPIIDLNRFLWDMPEVFADGLHGNVSGYTMMAQIYYKYVFGGELISVEMDTYPGANVYLKDKANNREYLRTAKNGTASIAFTPGSYNLTARALLDEYAGVSNKSVTLSGESTYVDLTFNTITITVNTNPGAMVVLTHNGNKHIVTTGSNGVAKFVYVKNNYNFTVDVTLVGCSAVSEKVTVNGVDTTLSYQLESIGEDISFGHIVATTQDSQYDSGKTAALLFDNDDSTYWQGNYDYMTSHNGTYAQAELDGVYDLVAFNIRFNGIHSDGKGTISVSLDGTNWTTVVTGIGFTLKEDEYYALDTPVQAKYVRFTVNGAGGGKGGLCPEVVALNIYA